MKVMLFGQQADDIRPILQNYAALELVETQPDVVICYGGDGTLLTAERQWPCIPKVPIKNSQHGNRCIAHPPSEVIERLAEGQLFRTEYMRLGCALCRPSPAEPPVDLTAMNEFSVHMARINSAVRFKLWFDDEAYGAGHEILGDGFVVSTPFGSTAYFNHITRGFFHQGIGIAFKSTSDHTNHVVVPRQTVVRILITRGPALLAYDNCPDYLSIRQGDELSLQEHGQPSVLLTWNAIKYPTDTF